MTKVCFIIVFRRRHGAATRRGTCVQNSPLQIYMESQFVSGISYAFEITCCAVAWLFSAFQLLCFTKIDLFERACCAVARNLSFSVAQFLMQYHMSLKLPVAMLLGCSQLFQRFDFFRNSVFETSCCAVVRNLTFFIRISYVF